MSQGPSLFTVGPPHAESPACAQHLTSADFSNTVPNCKMNLCLSYSNELDGHFVSSQYVLYTLSDLPWGKKKICHLLPGSERAYVVGLQMSRRPGLWAPGPQEASVLPSQLLATKGMFADSICLSEHSKTTPNLERGPGRLRRGSGHRRCPHETHSPGLDTKCTHGKLYHPSQPVSFQILLFLFLTSYP